MTNIFESVRDFQPGRFVIWVAAISIAAFVAGVVLLVEDTYTSRMGYQALEQAYDFQPRVFPLTYWAMSLTPQIAQIMFSYIFLTNPRKNWWALLALAIFFAIDFSSDVYHVTGALPGASERSLTSAAITLIFFSIGAEMFITWGIGLFLTTFPLAIRELRGFSTDARNSTFGTGRATRNTSGSRRSRGNSAGAAPAEFFAEQ